MHSHDLLEDSLLRKPFCDVAAAAQDVCDVVLRSIANDYGDISTRAGHKTPWWEEALAGWGLFGLFAAVGAGMITPALAPPVAFSAMAAAVTWGFRYDKVKKPSFQFAEAMKDLSKTIELLPDGPEKQLSRDFSATARQAFALGEAAVIQERIRQNTEPVRTLYEARQRGFRAIDELAKDTELDEARRIRLTEAFRTGQMRRPSAYHQLIDDANGKLQKILSGVTGSNRFSAC